MDPATSTLIDDRALPVISRADLASGSVPVSLGGAIRISTTLDHGLTELLTALRQRVERLAGLAEAPALTRARHRQSLESAEAALESALSAEPLELIAEDLRLAVRSIGSVTGRVDIEDVLDVIFRDFCIGK
jgi:tRNA modification GTPase